jgi:hypothetical protein
MSFTLWGDSNMQLMSFTLWGDPNFLADSVQKKKLFRHLVLALNHKYTADFSVSTKSVIFIGVIIGFGERAAKDEKRGRQLKTLAL